MQYGHGNEGQGREEAQRERVEKWARWVAEHPKAAAGRWRKPAGSPRTSPASERAPKHDIRHHMCRCTSE